MTWEATRSAALSRLDEFLPRAGRAYATNRNVDRGPADRSNVSALSPYLRRRMLTEEEVVRAVLSRHGFAAAEKFIQEVAWRTYWKGWLEMRPAVEAHYHAELAQTALAWSDGAGAKALHRAMAGSTGIDCFDAWADELVSSGWLHNHARMWFASIWIFTLRLPWQLGADFFARHLVDADPASNLLSWRWVAGLHTRGKHYLARAENIERNTLGRFAPYGQLDETAGPITDDPALPSPVLPDLLRPALDRKVALIVTGEDLHPESWQFKANVAAIAVLPSARAEEASSPAKNFDEAALADAALRASAYFGVTVETIAGHAIAGWMRASGVRQLVTAYAPAGPIARQLDAIERDIKADDMVMARIVRDWDRTLWPLATGGFFKMKARLETVVSQL